MSDDYQLDPEELRKIEEEAMKAVEDEFELDEETLKKIEEEALKEIEGGDDIDLDDLDLGDLDFGTDESKPAAEPKPEAPKPEPPKAAESKPAVEAPTKAEPAADAIPVVKPVADEDDEPVPMARPAKEDKPQKDLPVAREEVEEEPPKAKPAEEAKPAEKAPEARQEQKNAAAPARKKPKKPAAGAGSKTMAGPRKKPAAGKGALGATGQHVRATQARSLAVAEADTAKQSSKLMMLMIGGCVLFLAIVAGLVAVLKTGTDAPPPAQQEPASVNPVVEAEKAKTEAYEKLTRQIGVYSRQQNPDNLRKAIALIEEFQAQYPAYQKANLDKRIETFRKSISWMEGAGAAPDDDAAAQ